jgi:hypothetical protein
VLADAAFPNVPVPLVDHVPDAEFVDEAEIDTATVVEHVMYGPPALLVGRPWIVSSVPVLTALEHGRIGELVHVSVRLPTAMSAALGV